MKASETRLQPVLEGSQQYIVPLFQRHYSWTKRDWETLWNDLMELYQASDGREHFLGAIVTIPVDMQPHGVSKYLLIDGQQRLSTLFLILAAIRDLAAAAEDTLAAQINEQYLINKWAEPGNRYKLLPSQPDRDAFQKIVGASPAGVGKLVQAHRYYTRQLQNANGHGGVLDLRRFHDVLVRQIVVVSIVLAKDENPYRIFESLNGKGQPLTQADLVRNYLFMCIPDGEEQEIAYRELWRPMEEYLGDQLTNFLWRFLTKDGTFIRQNAIYDAIKVKLSASAGQKEVIDFVADLHTYSVYYRKLIQPEVEPNLAIRSRLQRLNRWEINTSYPFLLNTYHDFAHGRLTASQFCEILDIIESFVIRRFFCRIPTNALNRIFIALYNNLNRQDMVGATRSQLLARQWPSDEQFLAGWLTFPIYTSGAAKTRHILESLETALTHNNEPVDITHHRITIEHIMPQTLNEEWEQELGHDASRIHDTYLHTIGNLTLTGKNEPMGNASFAKKKPVFQESNFALNAYFAHCAAWNDQSIRQRANQLADTAFDIWRRPPTVDAASDSDDPTGHKPTYFQLFGEVYPAQTWKEVLVKVAEILVQRHGAGSLIAKISEATDTKQPYVAVISEGMNTPRLIPHTGLWIETNFSSGTILSLCRRLIATYGYPPSEFEAHWQ